jgi:hypothetical protein
MRLTRGGRLWRGLVRRLFGRGERRDNQRTVPVRIPAVPPPLPSPHVKYVLYRCGDGVFDVFDGDQMVGDLIRQDGDGHRETFWVATLYNAHFDWFRTLKAAKAWLGHPPVRRYRPTKTHHLDMSSTREKRSAPQR